MCGIGLPGFILSLTLVLSCYIFSDRIYLMSNVDVYW